MPFKSKAQRRKFYALKRQGKMDQATIDEWEVQTPKSIPERLKKEGSIMNYKDRFLKLAYGDAYASDAGAMLHWNDQGGLTPLNETDSAAAQNAELFTLPVDVDGASCASCKYFRTTDDNKGLGLCQNPEVRQDVTVRMLCQFWENPGALPAVEVEEDIGIMNDISTEEANGDIPPESVNGETSPTNVEGETSTAPDSEAALPPSDNSGMAASEPKKSKGDSKPKHPAVNINVGTEKGASLKDLVLEWL